MSFFVLGKKPQIAQSLADHKAHKITTENLKLIMIGVKMRTVMLRIIQANTIIQKMRNKYNINDKFSVPFTYLYIINYVVNI